MGREIRRVPPNWEHPRYTAEHSGDHVRAGQYIPMYDQSFNAAAREWLDKAIAWDNGTDPAAAQYKARHPFYWQWDGDPPDEQSYRPEFTEEPTWVQVYETVSEGTPVTPPFATEEELIEYLVAHGDFWDEKRGNGGRSREAATAFVKNGLAPSMIVAAGKVYDSIDSAAIK